MKKRIISKSSISKYFGDKKEDMNTEQLIFYEEGYDEATERAIKILDKLRLKKAEIRGELMMLNKLDLKDLTKGDIVNSFISFHDLDQVIKELKK